MYFNLYGHEKKRWIINTDYLGESGVGGDKKSERA